VKSQDFFEGRGVVISGSIKWGGEGIFTLPQVVTQGSEDRAKTRVINLLIVECVVQAFNLSAGDSALVQFFAGSFR
jgi:hypothetical protein